MSFTFRILGLDIAAVNSGAGVVEARVHSDGSLGFEVLEEQPLTTERIASNQPPTWDSMLSVAEQALDLCTVHGVSYVSYEGFARMARAHNTTAYEHAELVGLVKYRLFDSGGLTFVQIPPTTLPSFFGLKKGDKKATQLMLKETLGWSSSQRRVKQREDCSDAVAHAIIGGHIFAVLQGWTPPDDLPESKRRLLFGDDRKSSVLVGLLHRPHLYIPRDACLVPLEETYEQD